MDQDLKGDEGPSGNFVGLSVDVYLGLQRTGSAQTVGGATAQATCPLLSGKRSKETRLMYRESELPLASLTKAVQECA